MRQSILFTLAALLIACQAPSAPEPTSTSSQAPALAPAAESPPASKAVHPSSKATAGVMTTKLPADPNRIPNDAIHAAYRNSPATKGQLPSGHPPIKGAHGNTRAPFAGEPVEGESGVSLPLPLKGPGSVDELTRRMASVKDAAKKQAIEEAFRLTFTLERRQRDPARAKTLLTPLVSDPTLGATASRILGYVAVSQGFDVQGAMKHYGDAVEKDPDYGEAHYALAFMHVRGDKKAGLVHFERASALKVPDVRGIGRFYPEFKAGSTKQAVDPAP